MAFNNKNIALLAHLQDLAQRTDTLIQILNSRYDTEAYARIEDNDFLQRQIDTVATAVMTISCLYSEIKEQLRSGKSDSQ